MSPTPLRAAGALLGLALLLGCAGPYEDGDAVAEAPEETGDTGEVEEEEEEEVDGDPVDSGPADTGRRERKPRDGERGRRDRKEKKPGGGKEKPKPKPNPTTKELCFGGQGLDLRLDIDGTDATGSLEYKSGKVEVSVPRLSGSRKGSRVETSGTGTVNGKKKKVQVQAGKSDKGPVVRIDGNTVKGARIVKCDGSAFERPPHAGQQLRAGEGLGQ